MYRIFGNTRDIYQCMGYSAHYGKLGLNGIFGAVDIVNLTMYGILGNVWDDGQCI